MSIQRLKDAQNRYGQTGSRERNEKDREGKRETERTTTTLFRVLRFLAVLSPFFALVVRDRRHSCNPFCLFRYCEEQWLEALVEF